MIMIVQIHKIRINRTNDKKVLYPVLELDLRNISKVITSINDKLNEFCLLILGQESSYETTTTQLSWLVDSQ